VKSAVVCDGQLPQHPFPLTNPRIHRRVVSFREPKVLCGNMCGVLRTFKGHGRFVPRFPGFGDRIISISSVHDDSLEGTPRGADGSGEDGLPFLLPCPHVGADQEADYEAVQCHRFLRFGENSTVRAAWVMRATVSP
jgi:hypothetical protein